MLSAAEPAAGNILFTKRLRDAHSFPHFVKDIRDLDEHAEEQRGNGKLEKESITKEEPIIKEATMLQLMVNMRRGCRG